MHINQTVQTPHTCFCHTRYNRHFRQRTGHTRSIFRQQDVHEAWAGHQPRMNQTVSYRCLRLTKCTSKSTLMHIQLCRSTVVLGQAYFSCSVAAGLILSRGLSIYLERWRIFLRLRFKRLIRFFRHCTATENVRSYTFCLYGPF